MAHRNRTPMLARPLTAALLLSATLYAQDRPHSFNDRENLTLFSVDALARTLDWQSTRMRLADPCKCYHEAELPASIAQSSGRMLGYSLAVVVVVHEAARLAHRGGHHKIERFLPAFDALYDGRTVMSNYTLQPNAIASKLPLSPTTLKGQPR